MGTFVIQINVPTMYPDNNQPERYENDDLEHDLNLEPPSEGDDTQGSWDDEEDEDFDDQTEFVNDLHEIQVDDDLNEPDPEDDDHLPDDELN